jgi:peptidoglycan-N-acetylglucosamine deacetylase
MTQTFTPAAMTAYASTPAFKQEGFLAVAEGSAGQAPRARGTAKRTVHLTFDAEHPDRPHHRAEGAEAVLDVLAATGAKATFFLQGRWATANPRVARRIAQEGHTIGSHSNAHLDMTRLTDRGLTAEVKESEDRIRAVTAVDPRPYFRCPYGEGHEDARVVAALAGLQYQLIGWDVDPQDWNDELSTADVVTAIHAGIALPQTSDPIVLLHTWPAWTSQAVKQVVEVYPDDEVVWAPLEKPAAL